MSALASPVKHTTQSLAQVEADLRTEAVAIEKLRKGLGEAGSAAPKEQMADFAKRQKAYLDRKIDHERQKRAINDVGSVEPRANPTPSRRKEPTAIAASKATAPKPRAEFIVEKKSAPQPQSELPLQDFPVANPNTGTERTKTEEASAPENGINSGGLAPIVWIFLASAAALIAWYFLG